MKVYTQTLKRSLLRKAVMMMKSNNTSTKKKVGRKTSTHVAAVVALEIETTTTIVANRGADQGHVAETDLGLPAGKNREGETADHAHPALHVATEDVAIEIRAQETIIGIVIVEEGGAIGVGRNHLIGPALQVEIVVDVAEVEVLL